MERVIWDKIKQRFSPIQVMFKKILPQAIARREENIHNLKAIKKFMPQKIAQYPLKKILVA